MYAPTKGVITASSTLSTGSIACTSINCATNIFEDLPSEQVYHDLDMDTMNTITEQVSVWSNDDENTFFIIDDCALSLKNKCIQKALGNLIALRRHLKRSILLASQWVNAICLQLHTN